MRKMRSEKTKTISPTPKAYIALVLMWFAFIISAGAGIMLALAILYEEYAALGIPFAVITVVFSAAYYLARRYYRRHRPKRATRVKAEPTGRLTAPAPEISSAPE